MNRYAMKIIKELDNGQDFGLKKAVSDAYMYLIEFLSDNPRGSNKIKLHNPGIAISFIMEKLSFFHSGLVDDYSWRPNANERGKQTAMATGRNDRFIDTTVMVLTVNDVQIKPWIQKNNTNIDASKSTDIALAVRDINRTLSFETAWKNYLKDKSINSFKNYIAKTYGVYNLYDTNQYGNNTFRR